MISKFFNSLSKIGSDYISITVSEPYKIIRESYNQKSLATKARFSISEYIKKQKQMTSPEIRKDAYVNNCELRKTYIRDFSTDRTLH